MRNEFSKTCTIIETNSFGGSLYGIMVAKNGACGVTTNVAYWTPIDQITSQLSVTPILG